MPENMPKRSMQPASNRLQYAPSFTGMYQHLFVCHLLCPTDFQHPPPHPHFKCFQQFRTCFILVNVQVSAAHSATFQTVLFHFFCEFCSQFNFPVNSLSLTLYRLRSVARSLTYIRNIRGPITLP